MPAKRCTSTPFTVEVRHPDAPEWALPRAAPAEVGVSTCVVGDVLGHVFTDPALQTALLLRNGQVVGERYADGYGVENLVTSWSVAKSIYSAAIGIAIGIDEGHIESLDQEASEFLDEWVDTNKEQITIRNLLEMQAGFANANVFLQADQTEFSLDQPLIDEPGSTFLYSNNNWQLFEPLLLRATGVNAHLWLCASPDGSATRGCRSRPARRSMPCRASCRCSNRSARRSSHTRTKPRCGTRPCPCRRCRSSPVRILVRAFDALLHFPVQFQQADLVGISLLSSAAPTEWLYRSTSRSALSTACQARRVCLKIRLFSIGVTEHRTG